MQEIEAKILEVNLPALKTNLAKLGAKRSFSGELYAVFYDHPADSLPERGAVLRLRKEGDLVALTFKAKIPGSDPALKVMDEREVFVSDFEVMRSILAGLGYQEKSATRKLRTQYDLPGVHVVIDDYLDAQAHIPPFIEIEAIDEQALYATAERLGFAQDQLLPWNSFQLFQHYKKA